MKNCILLALLLHLFIASPALSQNREGAVIGTVIDSSDQTPLPGVNVLVKGTSLGSVTDEDGLFNLYLEDGEYELVFSFIGYADQNINLVVPDTAILTVKMIPDEYSLSGVEVVSTGLQELPAERATGSFVHIDRKLVERRVSANLIDRLEDVTPGLIFNRDRADKGLGESISIRGNSTFLAESQPLIVVDNLAYDGPLESINPNDIESITVLRDAASASIWGARAGNGVLVVTTKKGAFGSDLQVNFNSNVTFGQAFDPFFVPQMAISEFVDVEQALFARNYYNSQYNSINKVRLSPAVESLFSHRNGQLSTDDLESRLMDYRKRDVRRDLEDYLYSPSFSQQYSLGINGGTKNYSYQFSVGWDTNRQSLRFSKNDRITLNGNQSWKMADGRLTIGLGTYLSRTSTSNAAPSISTLYPYDRLADAAGASLSVYRDFNTRFKESFIGTDLLDWEYRPLDELGLSPSEQIQNDLRFTLKLGYQIAKGVTWENNYQYWTNTAGNDQKYDPTSYFVRNLVNLYSEFDETGNLIRHIPEGGIYNFDRNEAYSHNLRSQINYSSGQRGAHQLDALAGFEIKDLNASGFSGRAYGYNDDIGTSAAVNYNTQYPILSTGRATLIPFNEGFSGNTDRFLSVFANGGYTLKGRYTITGSLRRDGSNLFGAETNRRTVPLWSSGVGWIISEEDWMRNSTFGYLKLKASYGFNGNTNPSATAFTTAYYLSAAYNPWVGQPFLSVSNPPNPDVRWEKIKITNFGAEFELWKGRLAGSLELYRKEGLDLFGAQPIFSSSGVFQVIRNYAGTRTHGIDLALNGSLAFNKWKWTAGFFYSLVKEKVVRQEQEPTAAALAAYSPGLSGVIPSPLEGFPIFSIFSYPYAGLDPADGDPQGYVDGEPSDDYFAIFGQTEVEDLIFHGSAIPTSFGAFRNSLTFKGFEFSFNISYRLGYYFKRESINFDNLNRGTIGHSDYSLRWQNPGDELITDVPSDPLAVNFNRSSFDLYNSSKVRKGDHIRLQDVQFSYTLEKDLFPFIPAKSLQVYGYANNLGILWKAAKDVADPDFRNVQSFRTFSIGLRADF